MSVASVNKVINCLDYHDSCSKICFNKLIAVIKYTFKVYTIAHGVPLLIFKLNHLKTRPVEVILKFFDNVLRSMGFLGGYIMSMRLFHCFVYSRLLGRFSCKI